MDTTSINFALNKISEAYAKVAPSVANITEKYVHYIVSKQV